MIPGEGMGVDGSGALGILLPYLKSPSLPEKMLGGVLKVYLKSLYLTNFRKSTTPKKIKFLKKNLVFHKSAVKFSNLS